MSEKPLSTIDEALKNINKPLKALKKLKDDITNVTGGKETFKSLDFLQKKITENLIQKKVLETGVLIQNVQSKEDAKQKGTSWGNIVYPEYAPSDFVMGTTLITSVEYFLNRNSRFGEIVQPADVLPTSVKGVSVAGVDYKRSDKGFVDGNGNNLQFSQMGRKQRRQSL